MGYTRIPMLIQEVNPPVVIHAAPWEHYFPQNVYDYIYNMTLEIADEDYDLRRCFRKGEDWKQVLPTFFDDLVETVIEDYVTENYMPNTPYWPEGWESVVPDIVDEGLSDVIEDWQTYGCPPKSEDEEDWDNIDMSYQT